ncbi:MAG TPA: hypothetical protein VF761_16885 [Gemmatimonadaceae bacterium]
MKRVELTIEYDDGTTFTSELTNLTSLETEARRDMGSTPGVFTGPLMGRIVIEGRLRSEVRRDRDGRDIIGATPLIEAGNPALAAAEEVER